MITKYEVSTLAIVCADYYEANSGQNNKNKLKIIYSKWNSMNDGMNVQIDKIALLMRFVRKRLKLESYRKNGK